MERFALTVLFMRKPWTITNMRGVGRAWICFSAAALALVLTIPSAAFGQNYARQAAQLLGAPSGDLLERAGRLGLADTEIRSIAAQVIGHALDGAQRLGSGYIAPAHIAVAEQYFARALSAADI